MARTPTQRRRVIDRTAARREGRRWHAFYQGFQARRANRPRNPHRPGSALHDCWEAGWSFADEPKPSPPVCRFGPGGDFVRDWPEGQP